MNDDDLRPVVGADDEAARRADASPLAGGDAPQAPEAAASKDPAGDAGPQAAASEAPYGRVRYSRRRVLILGGAFAAGVAAVIAGLRAFGGSAATKVTDTISDQFGPFPVRSVEDVPDVPAEQWTVKVDGLVDTPLTVDHATWTSLQRMTETVDFHCVEGWGVDDVRWGGVAPSVLLDQAGVKPEAKYAVFHAYGGDYLSTLPLELVTDEKSMLADSLNGAPLPPKHGGPLRLVVPVQLGYKNVKWVERIELTDSVRAGYWEERGYPEDAPIPGA
jgi:DMSO/TMAO reductase YedYZ molybdopterin-dependent catalytic subunit